MNISKWLDRARFMLLLVSLRSWWMSVRKGLCCSGSEEGLAVSNGFGCFGLVFGGLGVGGGGLAGVCNISAGIAGLGGVKAYKLKLKQLDSGLDLYADLGNDGGGLLDDFLLQWGVSAWVGCGLGSNCIGTCCFTAYSSASLPGASSLARRDCSVASSRWYMASSFMRRTTEPVLIAREVGGAIVGGFLVGGGS